MTEPAPGAGADPTHAPHTARAATATTGSIDGHKWYITGAEGAAFAIVMARTSDDRTRGAVRRCSWSTPARPASRSCAHRRRSIGRFPGGHCEVRFADCRVPADAVLGEVDLGFDYAQVAARARPG